MVDPYADNDLISQERRMHRDAAHRQAITGDVCHHQELPAIRRPSCDRVGAPPRDVREDALLEPSRRATTTPQSVRCARSSPLGERMPARGRLKSARAGSPFDTGSVDPSRPRTTTVPRGSRYASRELFDDHRGQRARSPATFSTTLGARSCRPEQRRRRRSTGRPGTSSQTPASPHPKRRPDRGSRPCCCSLCRRRASPDPRRSRS